jgi:hypothetical protein
LLYKCLNTNGNLTKKPSLTTCPKSTHHWLSSLPYIDFLFTTKYIMHLFVSGWFHH